MTTLTVGRIDAHAVAGDAAVGRVLADRLTVLMERAARTLDAELSGLDDREVVCIREVGLALSLDDATTDEATARSWGRAIGSTIWGLVDPGGRPAAGTSAHAAGRRAEVVRYRDLPAALADLVASLAVGDSSRTWAWSLAGLTSPAGRSGAAVSVLTAVGGSPGRARTMVVDALRAHPQEAASAVVAAARSVGLAAVHRLLGDDGWREIALLLLEHAGSPASTVALLRDSSWSGKADPAGPSVPVPSELGDLAVRCGLRVPMPTALAWAVVALSDSRPGLLARPVGADAITALAAGLARTAGPETTVRPAGHESQQATDRSADIEEATGRSAGEPRPEAEPEGGPGLATSNAGLLFFLSVAGEVGLPDQALDDRRLAGREPSWVLGQVGARLAGVGAEDPAVRVFAGLPADAPVSTFEPADVEEAPALDEAASAWAAVAVRAMREHTSVQDEDDAALLRRVVRREGVLLGGRGSVEVVLVAADADVDVRRAGLDLDPGFVPWLGTVVRFRYE